MSKTLKKINKNKQHRLEKQRGNRKLYQKPLLLDLGDLRAVTLGASPGTGDSVNPGGLRV